MFEVFVMPLKGYKIRVMAGDAVVCIELAEGKAKGALRFSAMKSFTLELVKDGHIMGTIQPGRM